MIKKLGDIMKFSNQKRGVKYHEGFKAALEEVVYQLKQNKDQTIENIIKGFELAIELLDKKIINVDFKL
jgi:hypothetical protein